MNKLFELECDLKGLNSLSKDISKKINFGDIILLSGELGTGKTTFSRLFINSLFDKYSCLKPKKINSPTFPILITYPLGNYNIFHYDLYRLTNKEELFEIGFFEELKKNISLIEWPDIILKHKLITTYYFIEFKFVDFDNRIIRIYHTHKKNL